MPSIEHHTTVGLPNALEAVINHPLEVVEENVEAVREVVEGARQATEGALRGTWELGVNTAAGNIVWEDLGAAPRTAVWETGGAAKAMIWDTPGYIWKWQPSNAMGSFFKDGVWRGIRMPFVSVLNGAKGLLNIVPDALRGSLKTVSHVTGLDATSDGELSARNHGAIPAVTSALKGLGRAVMSPLGKTFKRFLGRTSGGVGRFDTGVRTTAYSRPTRTAPARPNRSQQPQAAAQPAAAPAQPAAATTTQPRPAAPATQAQPRTPRPTATARPARPRPQQRPAAQATQPAAQQAAAPLNPEAVAAANAMTPEEAAQLMRAN